MAIYSSKFISYSLIFFLNFLTGVEYAVILPTALQYLARFDGDQVDLGICLSAYSFSSLFSSPLMGKWSDKTRNTKFIVVFANLWQIGGSLMYFVGLNTKFIIAGRLVAGVGMGAISCTFSDIVKTTSIGDRTKILSRIMIGRQLGMIVGPAFNFILLELNFKLGPFTVDNLSGPGLLMASFWALLQILMIFFYKNLHEFDEQTAASVAADSSTNTNADDNQQQQRPEPTETSRLLPNQDDQEEDDRRHLTSGTAAAAAASTTTTMYRNIRIVDNSETGHFLVVLYNEYIREEVVAVLAVTFSAFFMQTALETLLTPYTREFFDWSDSQNSIFYAIAGLDIMIVFGLLGIIGRRVQDRVLLLIGMLGNLITLIFLIVIMPMNKRFTDTSNDKWLGYVMFMLPVFGNVSSLPLIVLGSISLLSKVTRMETQGLTQGVRRAVVGLACILGPIWSGAFYGQWYILIGSLIGLMLMGLCMIVLSFKHLTPLMIEHQHRSRAVN